MRLRGRTLRPSTVGERRLMHHLGCGDVIRVPRKVNVFIFKRRFERAARCQTPDHMFIRNVVGGVCAEPRPSPGPDLPEPVLEDAT